MLAVTVEFLHGTVRAGSADDTVLAGGVDRGDWPPSPARLFAALVAGDGTRGRSRFTDGSELALLEHATPPKIFADARRDVLSSPLRERFVVLDEANRGSVHEYPARQSRVARGGTRLSPATPQVIYVWDDVEVSDGQLAALAVRAARVGYVGCADSPARVTVAREAPTMGLPAWEPDPEGSTPVPVPFPGLVDTLDAAFDRLTAGEPVRRGWYRTERVAYRSPDDPTTAPTAPLSTVLGIRFDHAVPGRRLLSVTETLKAAVLDLYQRHVAGPGGEVPSVLHGHGFDGTGYQLAWWLALPEAGYRYARGRLHGAAVVLPADTKPDVIDGVRTALFRLRTLSRPGSFSVDTSPYGGQPRPWSATPGRWVGPSRRWVSVTPVVHERRHRRGPDLAEVSRWCHHAGFPAPVSFRVSPVPLITGGLALHPAEVFHGQERRPYSHLEIEFAEPVTGPVVLGRARQYGLGLMAPLRDPAP